MLMFNPLEYAQAEWSHACLSLVDGVEDFYNFIWYMKHTYLGRYQRVRVRQGGCVIVFEDPAVGGLGQLVAAELSLQQVSSRVS